MSPSLATATKVIVPLLSMLINQEENLRIQSISGVKMAAPTVVNIIIPPADAAGANQLCVMSAIRQDTRKSSAHVTNPTRKSAKKRVPPLLIALT